jgi:hypothetical protein
MERHDGIEMADRIAVLVLDPGVRVLGGPSFGADDLRAAVDGTGRLTVRARTQP